MFGGSLIVISAIAPSPPQLHQLQIRLAHGFHGHLRPKKRPSGFKAELLLLQAFLSLLADAGFSGGGEICCGAPVFSRFLQDPQKASVLQKQPADRCGFFTAAP